MDAFRPLSRLSLRVLFVTSLQFMVNLKRAALQSASRSCMAALSFLTNWPLIHALDSGRTGLTAPGEPAVRVSRVREGGAEAVRRGGKEGDTLYFIPSQSLSRPVRHQRWP